MTSGVYAIINKVNSHKYIGSSVDIHKRWSVHRCYLNQNRHHCIHLQNAWNKYGAENFEFDILLECAPDSLVDNEQELLDSVHPEYNALSRAGSPLGHRHSEETKAKIRSTRHTEEAKEKIRSSKLGKRRGPHSEEWKAKVSLALKGKHMSDATKRNMSAAQKGNKKNLGNHHSKETKAKMSLTSKKRQRNLLGQYV